MATIYQRDKRLVADTVTGRYVTWTPADRETFSFYFIVHEADGTPILGTEITVNRFSETGGGGPVMLVRAALEKAWIPNGLPRKPDCFSGPGPALDFVPEFLEAREIGLTPAGRALRFEYRDQRATDLPRLG